MRAHRTLIVSVAAALVLATAPAPSLAQVLVPGDPPLTRENVDRFRRLWEWYCAIRLTPEQDRQLEHAFAALWRRRLAGGNRQALANHEALDKEWRALLDQKPDEQRRARLRTRAVWIGNMRKSTDDVSRLLVPIYDAAYRPGGPSNPILVPGDPALTRGMAERDNDVLELLFALPLTAEQRRKSVRLLVEQWKGMPQAAKRKWARDNATWDRLPTWGSYVRSLRRAFARQKLLEAFRKSDSRRDRWLLALYEAAYKPGSERNPVLVAGDPPLTQQLVDRYGDYLEVMLDLSLSGGFTPEQRTVLQGYLVKDWKTMSAAERSDLLADLKTWEDAASAGTANRAIGALRPKLLAQLRTARDNQRSAWLLEVREGELKKFAGLSERQRVQFEAMRALIENTRSRGHYEYRNGRSIWVADP